MDTLYPWVWVTYFPYRGGGVLEGTASCGHPYYLLAMT